jgi:D-alanyl-D-alanine carboxypeptidase (penicillin-binding protein 5/6)
MRLKKVITHFFALLLAVLIAVQTLAVSLFADVTSSDEYAQPEIMQANAACVYNIENKTYIFDKNKDKQIYPASTVKLMTAILAVEALGNDLDRKVTVTSAALEGVKGNNIALKRDEVLTVRELLQALICGCANDAANVLAIETAGSIENFVAMMNQKADEIGATNTKYTNPTGIHHPAMVTTAADTALIAAYAHEYALILEISSAEKFRIEATNKQPERIIFNKNYYFASNIEYKYRWSVPRGLNTGYTAEGGYCLVTSAAREGLTYIVVVMGARADEQNIYSYVEASKLVTWALKAYGYTMLLTTSDMICEIPVKLASRVDYVTLFPSENIELYLPVNADIKNDVHLTWQLDVDSFIAPVSEGQLGGRLTVTYNGNIVGTYELVTRNSVSRNNILYVLDLIRGIIETPQLKMIVTIIILTAVGYFLLVIYLSLQRQRRRRRR